MNSKIVGLVIFLVLFFTAFCWFSIGYKFFNLDRCHYDEGIVTFGASRILKGAIPYKDFWTLYAPGHFYLLAGIFKLFGVNLNVSRLFAVVILSLISYTVYFVASKVVLKKFALLGFLYSLAWLKSYVVYNRTLQPAILFSILTLLFILKYIYTNAKRWLFTSGILIGIVTLFRQDFGFYVFVTAFSTVLVYHFKFFFKEGFRNILKLNLIRISVLISGIFVVVIPVIAYFYFNSGLQDLIKDTIIFPLKVYPKVRYIPYPNLSIDNIIFYIPFFILLIALVSIFKVTWNNGTAIEKKIWAIIFCFILTLGLFVYTGVLSGHCHLLPTMIPVILIFVFIFDDLVDKITKKVNPLLSKVFLTIFFIISFILMYQVLKDYYFIYNRDNFFLNSKRAKDFLDNSKSAYYQTDAIEFIRENTDFDEKIFVANIRHDKVVNSDVMFYFLSERDSATKYYELHPGVTPTREVQERIIKDLQDNDVRFIIKWCRDWDSNEPNESSKSSKIFLLDEFIDKNYKLVKRFGEYFILLKG